MSGTLLLVDDNAESLSAYELAFSRSDYRVLTAPGGPEALDALENEPVDVVVTDLRMPEVDGMEVLSRALSLRTPPAVILLTAHGTVESAVEALHRGAADYVQKPVKLKELRAQVEKAMAHQRLRRENERLKAQLDERFGFEGVIGETPEMLELMKKVRLVAESRATVLIQGESGTGKELIARAVHRNSPRRNRPFVAVHCAAIAETLLESELFGHEKGAFTGAVSRRRGRFETADGGTLFLDEVGEIPLSMQVKLLRVIETLEFTRVGGTESVRVDVRLVAASNRDLAEQVAQGAVREDLFYRLNVVTLSLPPLRRRLGDLPLLLRFFVEDLAREHERPAPRVAPEALRALSDYDWPGNIRELRNVVENLLVFLEGDTVLPEHLPAQFAAPGKRRSTALGFGPTLEEAEVFLIRQALEAHEGNRTHAARSLGISRRTLQRKIKDLDLG